MSSHKKEQDAKFNLELDPSIKEPAEIEEAKKGFLANEILEMEAELKKGLARLIERYNQKDWIKYIELRTCGYYRTIRFVYDKEVKNYLLRKDQYEFLCKELDLKPVAKTNGKNYRLIRKESK